MSTIRTLAAVGLTAALTAPIGPASASASASSPSASASAASDGGRPTAAGTTNSWLCAATIGSPFRFKVATRAASLPAGSSWLITSSYTDGHQLQASSGFDGLSITEESLTQVRITATVALPPRTTFRLKPAYIVYRSSPATVLSLIPQTSGAGNQVDTHWRIGDTPCG